MTQKINTKSTADRRLRVMLGAHFVWLGVVCLLGGWWWRLLLRQAGRIAELEQSQGWAKNLTENYWHRTQRMLFWESATFFSLLLASTALLFWLYWRDVKRARGLQAFFASVTHELRTPLTSIRLQAESIADNLLEDASQKKLVHRLMEDSIRLEAQVERTLELARVEGGGPVYIQQIEVKPWLDRFLKSWAADYREKVECQSKIDDAIIEADPTALKVIFKNLLENSVRHAKREKVIISITSVFKDKTIILVLKDDGQGFLGDEKKLGKIFQKGVSSSGTGVGLYLVKVLMKRMGGWVHYSSCSNALGNNPSSNNPSGNNPSGFEVSLCFKEGMLHG